MHILAPQFGKSKVQLIAISEFCVRLSWEEPEFPGSPVIEYQVYIGVFYENAFACTYCYEATRIIKLIHCYKRFVMIICSIFIIQHSCLGGQIQQDAKDDTTVTSCGHEPYTKVTCTLIASNDAGNSPDESMETTTFCGGKCYIYVKLQPLMVCEVPLYSMSDLLG